MGNLYAAHRQWQTRPADERFWTLGEAHDRARNIRGMSYEKECIPYRALRAEVQGDLHLTCNGRDRIGLTHWSFGQLCTRIGAPSAYLRSLSPDLAAQNLNYGFENRSKGEAAMLVLNGEVPLARAFTSEDYARVWNDDVFALCERLMARGWRVPPARPVGDINRHLARPATEADVLKDSGFGLSVKVGDLIAPAGIYAHPITTCSFFSSVKVVSRRVRRFGSASHAQPNCRTKRWISPIAFPASVKTTATGAQLGGSLRS